MTFTGGTAPLATNGIFQLLTATNGNAYQILGGPGATNGSGTYVYTNTGPQTASISCTDSGSGVIRTLQLFFTSTSAGFFYSTQSGSSGSQFGNFSLHPGVVLFLGNVKFNPDTNRSASVLFPANGTPVSLSVTDAAGYLWTLNFPADALGTPTAIVMTPFASKDSSAALLPVASGVKLEPDGIQFQDGVRLSLTAPAGALSNHPAMAMADGNGANLYFVQATNLGNTYSNTLYHFSSSSIFNPSDAQWQQLEDQYGNSPNGVLPEALAAASQAILSLTYQYPPPQEPPDCGFTCLDNIPAVYPYADTVFTKEFTAIQNLEYVLAAQKYLTGQDSSAVLRPEIERMLSSTCFNIVDDIFKYWHSDGLKYKAAAVVANRINSVDLQYGGGGRASWKGQLQSWLQGPVVDHYINNIKSKHDYSAADAVQLLQLEFKDHSVDPSAMTQKFASALSFQATIKLSLSGTIEGAEFSEIASGIINITGDPVNVFPIAGTNNIDYTSGSIAGGVNLHLPLSYPQRFAMVFDGCGLAVYSYLSTPGADLSGVAVQETWQRGTGSYTATYLESAFESAYMAYLITPPVNDYIYGVQTGVLENMDSGALDFIIAPNSAPNVLSGVKVELRITLDHTPQ